MILTFHSLQICDYLSAFGGSEMDASEAGREKRRRRIRFGRLHFCRENCLSRDRIRQIED